MTRRYRRSACRACALAHRCPVKHREDRRDEDQERLVDGPGTGIRPIAASQRSGLGIRASRASSAVALIVLATNARTASSLAAIRRGLGVLRAGLSDAREDLAQLRLRGRHPVAIDGERRVEQDLEQQPGEHRVEQAGGVMSGLVVAEPEDAGEVRPGVPKALGHQRLDSRLVFRTRKRPEPVA